MAINIQDLIRELQQGSYTTPGIGDGIPGNTRIDGGINPVYNQAAPENVDPNTINVEGVQAGSAAPAPSITPDDLVPRSLGNLADAQEVEQANRNTREGMQHKGMFGLKGTLRDVLGLLGDSLLVGSGKGSVYDKARQRELEGDAVAGFTRDPGAAAERATGVNTQLAKELQTLAVNEQLKRAQLQSAEAARQSLIDQRRAETLEKAGKTVAKIFASPVAKTRPDLAIAQAREIARQTGIPLEDLGIKENMTPEEMDLYSYRGIDVSQTRNLPMKERQLDISQQNADANTTRANRPPAGRAPSNPTAASMAAPLIRKLQGGAKLTPGETETLDRLGYNVPTAKKSGGRATPRPSGVAPKRTFRVIRD